MADLRQGVSRPDDVEPAVERQGVALTFDEYRAAQVAEYSRYVAKEAIYHEGVLAYRAGDPVPVSNVVTHGYDKAGLVEDLKPPVSDKKPASK